MSITSCCTLILLIGDRRPCYHTLKNIYILNNKLIPLFFHEMFIFLLSYYYALTSIICSSQTFWAPPELRVRSTLCLVVSE